LKRDLREKRAKAKTRLSKVLLRPNKKVELEDDLVHSNQLVFALFPADNYDNYKEKKSSYNNANHFFSSFLLKMRPKTGSADNKSARKRRLF